MASRVGLPVPNPTRSFWTDTPVANSLATEGDLCTDIDICIIGSGITGVSAAYHLARLFSLESDGASGNRNPTRAVILEAREFCEH
jgi:NADH dehydrogenase FAD-containing subunit